MDRDVITEAKDIGLNLSKTCENALKSTIKLLTNSNNTRNDDFSSSVDSSDNSLVREVGFEPTKAYTTGVKNIEDFGDFLRIDLQMSEMTVKEYTRQMRRFFKTTKLDPEHVSG